MKTVRSFLTSTRGATSIEYSVIALVIAVVVITGVALVGDNLALWWDYIGSEWSKIQG